MTAPDFDLGNTDLTALGARLQNARKAARRTQQEAADALGVARTTLVAIEKGQRRITPEELVALAELYGANLHDLLRRRAPAGGLDVQFKAYFKGRGTANPEEGDRLEQAAALLQGYAENYLDLEETLETPLPRNYPSEYDVRGIGVEAAADEVAEAERRRLGLGDSPIADLRAVLETEVGLRIFFLDLDSRVAGLFGYTEELGGCVAINAKHPPDRQRLSLAHEYAHFLTQRQRPDVQVLRAGRLPESERFAEAFARRLLLPSSAVLRHLRNHMRHNGKPKVADLVHLALYFHVSFEAYVRRLEELGVLGVGTFDRLKLEGFKVREAQDLVGANPDEPSPPKFPQRYTLLALEALERGLISEGRAARLLEVDRLEVRELLEQSSGQSSVNAEGEVGWVRWQVGEDLAVRSR
ncbi:XRE family transcriptional regulator [Deinococcus sp. YIM 134068]|uniref:XRE family transcriptional regulator n=1 Tax=Deinococcus lichenicola TaxID=3118910 RepID=UPI002F921DC7